MPELQHWVGDAAVVGVQVSSALSQPLPQLLPKGDRGTVLLWLLTGDAGSHPPLLQFQ